MAQRFTLAMHSRNGLSELLCIAQEDWDTVWRRNQLILAELASRQPDATLLFVELPCDISYGLRTGNLFRSSSPVRQRLARMRAGLRRLEELPNIYLLVAPKFLPDSLDIGFTANRKIYASVIRRAMRQLDMSRPLIWTQDPLAGPVIDRLPYSKLIYDVTDEWAAVESFSDSHRDRLRAGDAALTQRADVVLACSEVLYEKRRAVNTATHLVPNGVDLEHFGTIDSGRLTSPILAFPRPILGYTGTLHDERLDISLVEVLADKFRTATLVFVGPDSLTRGSRERLRRHGNVVLLGPVPYAEIPAYLQEFDVCILPHLVNEFTESLNPIKAFEYLASRRPIVTTAVAGVRELAGVCIVASDHSGFLDGIQKALDHRQCYDARPALAIARENSWKSRVDAIVDIISAN